MQRRTDRSPCKKDAVAGVLIPIACLRLDTCADSSAPHAEAEQGAASQMWLMPYKIEDYLKVARMFRIWPYPRGHHRNLLIMPVHGSRFLLADQRFCPLLPDQLKVLPSPTLQPTAAAVGKDCIITCKWAPCTSLLFMLLMPGARVPMSRLAGLLARGAYRAYVSLATKPATVISTGQWLHAPQGKLGNVLAVYFCCVGRMGWSAWWATSGSSTRARSCRGTSPASAGVLWSWALMCPTTWPAPTCPPTRPAWSRRRSPAVGRRTPPLPACAPAPRRTSQARVKEIQI